MLSASSRNVLALALTVSCVTTSPSVGRVQEVSALKLNKIWFAHFSQQAKARVRYHKTVHQGDVHQRGTLLGGGESLLKRIIEKPTGETKAGHSPDEERAAAVDNPDTQNKEEDKHEEFQFLDHFGDKDEAIDIPTAIPMEKHIADNRAVDKHNTVFVEPINQSIMFSCLGQIDELLYALQKVYPPTIEINTKRIEMALLKQYSLESFLRSSKDLRAHSTKLTTKQVLDKLVRDLDLKEQWNAALRCVMHEADMKNKSQQERQQILLNGFISDLNSMVPRIVQFMNDTLQHNVNFTTVEGADAIVRKYVEGEYESILKSYESLGLNAKGVDFDEIFDNLYESFWNQFEDSHSSE